MLTTFAAVVRTVRRLVGDFNTVRRGANREVSHVVKIGTQAHFQMSREMRDFGVAYYRLPKWLRRLAVCVSNRKDQAR